MTLYSQECEGEFTAIISDAYIFEAVETTPGVPLKNRYFTQNAAWDTGAEVSIISSKIVEALGLKPFTRTTLMGIGGYEEVDVYKVHIGLPNGYLYKNRYMYCSNIEGYDVLLGMDIISKSDFFITNIKGNNRFLFRIPAEGGKGLLDAI